MLQYCFGICHHGLNDVPRRPDLVDKADPLPSQPRHLLPVAVGVGGRQQHVELVYFCLLPEEYCRPITGRLSRTVGTSARRSVHSSTTRLRRTRIGLKCGHSGPKIDERTVCSPLPSTRRRLCSEWTAASRVATSRVPTQTPSAPSASAPATPRPSTIPPEASTNAGDTASRISGTNTIVGGPP
jgi:hypothetical protein